MSAKINKRQLAAEEYPFPSEKSRLSTGMPLGFANMTGGARGSAECSVLSAESQDKEGKHVFRLRGTGATG